jgi:hypothetical protein
MSETVSIDRLNMRCRCGEGRLREMSITNDLDGTVTCESCGTTVPRHDSVNVHRDRAIALERRLRDAANLEEKIEILVSAISPSKEGTP